MSTRSKRAVTEDTGESTPAKAAIPQKVFLFDEQLLENSASQVIQKFYHPGLEEYTYFIVNKEAKTIQEVISFEEPNRCWFINQNAHSNGALYMTVPVDPTFLVLHYLKIFCKENAMQLDQLCDAQVPKAPHILSDLVDKKSMEVIADVKTIDDSVFYKYNEKRALTWLLYKVDKVKDSLMDQKIYCGVSSLSANYMKSLENEETSQEEYLRVAVGIVSHYLDLDLVEKMKCHLGIKDKLKVVDEPATPASKRKSVKQEITSPDNESSADDNPSKKIKVVAEKRKISAKDERMAKAARGSLNISSFFCKK